MKKTVKKHSALLITLMVFMISGTTVFAGATASGSLKYNGTNYACTGAVTYSVGTSTKKLKATTTCSLTKASLSTKVRGRFTKNGEPLSWKQDTGNKLAEITSSSATGFKEAYGTHSAYYGNASWNGGTDI